MWHKRSCLLGECVECGVNLLRVCPSKMSSEKLVKWKSIGYKVVGTIDKGNQSKASTLEYRETTPHELIQYLKPKLQAFVLHNNVAS
jgi:Zn ribbon nucleic-acid-binding protein